MCTFCLSFLTGWCVLRFVICRCLNMQSTEVAISACTVYIYNDLGVVICFIVRMWQYILRAIHMYSVITSNTSWHKCIFILNICLPGTNALAQRNMFKCSQVLKDFRHCCSRFPCYLVQQKLIWFNLSTEKFILCYTGHLPHLDAYKRQYSVLSETQKVEALQTLNAITFKYLPCCWNS